MKKLLIAFVALAFACSTTPPPATTEMNAAPAAKKAFYGEHGFDLAGMDSSVKACDDFYRFAVGKWRDTHPLPAQYARFGRFEELADRNRETLRAILEEDAKMTDTEAGSTEQRSATSTPPA